MANLSNINNKFLVTTGGNVLIGKTAVTGTSKLQVSGSLLIGTDISSGIPLVVQETTADGFAIGFMRNTNATNGNGLVIDVNSTAGAYIQDWRQASTVKMRLLQNGNLGIGTDSPDFALDIEAVSSGVQLQIGRTNTSAGSTWMGSDSNGFHLGVGTYGAGNSVTDPNGFTVLTSGNVGIGTVSPTSKLDISDAVDRVMNSNGEGQFEITGNGYTFGIAMGNTTTALYHNSDVRSLTLGTNETPRLTILGGGNVGIGVTSPGAKLDVDGSIRLSTSGTVEGRSYPYTTNIGSGADATTTYLIAGSTASLVTSIDLAGASAANPKTIIFKTASTERMRITSGGRVEVAGNVLSIDTVDEYREDFTTTGASTPSFDIDLKSIGASGQPFEVFVAWTHYSTAYGAGLHQAYYQRSTVQSDITLIHTYFNQTSSNGGAWSVVWLTGTEIRVQKSSGTHSSSGYGYIRVTRLKP
jgi:hypothetical protein